MKRFFAIIVLSLALLHYASGLIDNYVSALQHRAEITYTIGR